MNKSVETALMWLMAVFYGVLVSATILFNAFKLGFKKYFSWEVIPRPACVDDPDIGTHGYLHLEDVRIHYVASGPEDKPLMLFVHGFPEFWFSWRHQMKEFRKDYRVVAFDMRGYGESDKPKGIKPYAVKYLMSDIKQVISALGYKSCILVAHDWGGAIAWAFGSFYPDFVDKLIILNAPPAPVIQKLFVSDSDQRKKSWYMFMFQLPFLPELMLRVQNFSAFEEIFKDLKSDEDAINAYKHTFSQPGALTPPINYYRAALQLKRVSYNTNYIMPVLLIWGCKDTALGMSIPRETKKMNPKIEVKYLEAAHHFVQNEDPEGVNKAMREWLAVAE